MTLTKNVYTLPFEKKYLTKIISDPRAHFAYFKDAIDFELPEGTEILAPADGTVIDIKVDSREGSSDPKYNDMKYLNYMTLEHSNGEYSQYMHLKHEGTLVKLGEKVRQGQPIAISGNTGFTGGPHLHFQVIRLNKTKIGWGTLEVRFKEKVEIDKSEPPFPKEMEETLKELEKVRKQIEGEYKKY